MASTYRKPAFDEEAPPDYTPFPRPEEQSIDAGAGAPIVRTVPPHLVINPSDPRSQFAHQYFRGPNSSQLERPQAAPSGPIPYNPHSQGQINGGYEQLETPNVLTPAEYAEHEPPENATSQHDTSRYDENPLYRPVTANPPVSHPTAGPTAATTSYSSLRSNPTVCPTCRNSGWVRASVPCTCVAGVVARESYMRPQHRSLFGLIDDVLNPQSHIYVPTVPPAPTSYYRPAPPQNPQEPYFLQYVPGPGTMCPNCMGQSYFRNPQARGLPVTREMERHFNGHPPPPCSVCCDRGRIQ
ncbi:hypothetical protein GQ54DRAFT_265207 [Martensiomyces pterosporus]|nr:hypothetical protein GQ54DRAFT_265207 [Martensiomyces pterosporus]